MASMQEYLKRYTGDADKKKKKKKKKSKPSYGSSLTIVDAEPIWQKDIKEDSSESESEKEDAPLIIEDVEFKRLKRLEMLRTRPYIGTAEDGSGWVAVINDDQAQVLGEEDLVVNESTTEDDLHAGLSSSTQQKDLSPLRRPIHFSPRTNLHEQESLANVVTLQQQDLSPPRRRSEREHHNIAETTTGSRELSLSRRERDKVNKHEGMDISPPRRASRRSDDRVAANNKEADLSPRRRLPKRDRHDSPESISFNKGHVLNGSPSRRTQTYAYKDDKVAVNSRDRDLSSPRRHLRKVRHDSPESVSLRTGTVVAGSYPRGVPTHTYKESRLSADFRDTDLSPPRKHSRRVRHDSPESIRVQANKSSDKFSSTEEKIDACKDGKDLLSTSRRHIDNFSAPELSKPKGREAMEDGTSAGLNSGTDIAKEAITKKKTELKRMKELDITISGRNASTVYRDKHGRRLEGVDEILKLQQVDEPKKDKPLEWGKGLVQKREAETKHAEIEAEKSKPFARTIEDLDAILREQVRWGDPMAHLVKKKTNEPALADLGASEKMKDSGFIIPQQTPAHSWLKRNITAPPNRYGIKPGRHWDGVDRSTGYERDMFKKQNERKAEQEEAYLWSVADM